MIPKPEPGRPAAAAILGFLALATPACAALAQEAAPTDEIDRRLRFLEERLDAGRTTAQVWQYGWSGVFAVSAASNAWTLVDTDDGDDRVRAAVDGVKSVGALAQMLLNPLPARLGADPMRAEPGRTREQRLALGESQLQVNAARAEERFDIRQHLKAVGVNLIGGGVIWAFGDSGDALASAATGILVSEAQIWSQPWRASGDLRDYRSTFPGALSWEIRPRPNGVELAFRF